MQVVAAATDAHGKLFGSHHGIYVLAADHYIADAISLGELSVDLVFQVKRS